MAEAIGFSHLYPAVPIMNFFAMALLLPLVSSFWKTRIVALVALLGWLFVANFLSFISMIHWRGHTDDALVFASIVGILGRAQDCGSITSMACFAHFTWQRLHPNCVRNLYDTRRRNNLIHVFFTLILPLLWLPLDLLSSPARYIIVEDYGLTHFIRPDWPGFVLNYPPSFLTYLTAVVFNFLTLVNYWRMKRKGIDTDILKLQSPVQTRKLLLMAVINMLFAIYGLCVGIIDLTGNINKLSAPTSMAQNIASLQIVITKARSDVPADINTYMTTGRIITPLLAFYYFAWFGLAEEARKAYVEVLLKLGRPISATRKAHWPHLSTPTFSWPATAPLQAKIREGLNDILSLVLPNAPHITPYTSSVPPDDLAELPASPIRIQPPNTVGDRTDVKQQGRVPSREPAGRLSLHKPPLAAVTSANAIPSVLDVPLRRLSHHKPPFVPSAPTAPVIATPHASRSNPPSVEAANNTRRHEKFGSRPSTRRLSYHKPAFIPLAPANVNGAVPNTSAPTMPLAEIPREIVGEMNAVLQAESVVEDRMAPPPFSTISTAPPPFPTPPTATSAPPYRVANPFLDDIHEFTHEQSV